METQDGADLCFPQLPNISCKKISSPRSKVNLPHIMLSVISLLIVVLNLLVIISVFHFRHGKTSKQKRFFFNVLIHLFIYNTCNRFLIVSNALMLELGTRSNSLNAFPSPSRQLHTPTNILLLSLAVSDFLVGLLLMPGEILRYTSCWFLGDLVCSLFNYVSYVITSASIGDMMLISVERYVAICDPLHYPTRVTERRVKLCVCLCWLCSVLYFSFIFKDDLIKPGRHNSCYGECIIVVENFFATVDLFISFVIPVTVIVVLYMRVFVVAVFQARAMRSHITTVTFQLSVSAAPRKSELKAARTLGLLIVVFLICFCPYYCVFLAGDELLNDTSASFVSYLFYFNSCVNPIIYAMFYPWFRKAVKLIITLKIFKSGSRDANIL